jgi:hypothetical protein
MSRAEESALIRATREREEHSMDAGIDPYDDEKQKVRAMSAGELRTILIRLLDFGTAEDKDHIAARINDVGPDLVDEEEEFKRLQAE